MKARRLISQELFLNEIKPPAIIGYESAISQQSRRELETLIFAQDQDTQSTEEYYKGLLHELEAAFKQYKKLDVYKIKSKDGGVLLELALTQEGKPIAIFQYDAKLLPDLKKVVYFRSGKPALSVYLNSNNWRDYKSIDRVVVEKGTSDEFIKFYEESERGRKELERELEEAKEKLKKFREELEKLKKQFE